MRSCTSCPTGLSASAVTIAVSSPKQRFNPRATLYSPPPSQTWKLRVVAMRPSPGSSRSITSPRLTRSQRHAFFDLTASGSLIWTAESLLFETRGFESWNQQLDYDECRQIRAARDDEDRHVTSRRLQNVAHDFRNKHTTDRTSHSANADHRTDGLPGKHVGGGG